MADDTERRQLPDVRPSLKIIRQYIKDISFESPHLPEFMSANVAAREDMEIGCVVVEITPDMFEVSLLIQGRATRNQLIGHILEFTYSGFFNMSNFPPEQVAPALHIEGAELLFPSARKILMHLLQANGFPFRMKPTLDFVQVYADRLAKGAPPITRPARRSPAA